MIITPHETSPESRTTWTASLPTEASTLSDTQRDWLTDTGSLTRRFYAQFPDDIDFAVEIANTAHATPSEAKALDIDPEVEIWLRKIIWSGYGHTWVACRSVIPSTTLDDRLRQLGKNSLGNILFGNPTCPRSPFLFTSEYNNGHLQISRRSFFQYNHKPLLITETFTHDFFNDAFA